MKLNATRPLHLKKWWDFIKPQFKPSRQIGKSTLRPVTVKPLNNIKPVVHKKLGSTTQQQTADPLLPKVSFNMDDVLNIARKMTGVIIILSINVAFLYGLYLIKYIVDSKVFEHKKTALQVEEYTNPIMAKVQKLEREVSDLQAHANIVYYKQPKKLDYEVLGKNKKQ